MDASPALAPGTRLGPYTLLEVIGRGATAVVHLAEDDEGQRVAVKARRRGVTALDRRFLREFESMRALRVPGVVRVYEAGIEDEVLWFSMEHVDGRPFSDLLLAEADLAARVRKAIPLGRQFLDILAELHQAGLVHRDVKPSNVLVDREGQVRVLDFGIVRYFGDTDTLSDSGQLLGTVPFMSPEQLSGLPFGRQVDLFATGLMLHESLAGPRARPQSPVGWIPRICLERLDALAGMHAEVPRALSALIERLLSADPRDRGTAQQAAHALRRLEHDEPSCDWPEAPFHEPGEWWNELEGCLGQAGSKPVQALEGPAGSGRRRLSEQLHRHATLQGIWPVHVRCRVEAVGAALEELVSVLLASLDDERQLRHVLGDDHGVLQRMWPHLPLPARPDQVLPSLGEVSQAVVRTLRRAADQRSILLVVHDLEHVDALTERALRHAASVAGKGLGMLLLHESRWRTPRSQALLDDLEADDRLARHAVRLLGEAEAAELAASLCPHATEAPRSHAGTPQRAVEAGLATLAAWRGEPFTPPEDDLWPLVVRRRPVSEDVLARLVGRAVLDSPWVKRGEGGAWLQGDFAWRSVRSRVPDLRTAARSLASAWESVLGTSADPADLVALRLLADDAQGAVLPAAHAALEAERAGRYADARRWLLLLETLPSEVASESVSFKLACVRTRVALRTDLGRLPPQLVEQCERLARTPDQEREARVLKAEVQLREGEVRSALVAALRIASPQSDPEPVLAVRALLVATRCRFALGQPAEAAPQLKRARALLAGVDDAHLEVEVDNGRAELLLRRHQLLECRSLSQSVLRRASERRDVLGAAQASARLGQVLRMLGRRREAEVHARSARDAFAATGDVLLDAEAELALATLRAERGDGPAARHLLDEAIRRIRALNLDHLLPTAMRIALQVATLRADPAEATVPLSALEHAPGREPEAPAALVRWWRTRGDVDRAMDVPPPDSAGYGHVLWRVERARAALGGGDDELARGEAHAGHRDAIRLGFAELQVHARLLLGLLDQSEEQAWRELLRKAANSLWIELYLGAIELEARRLTAAGDHTSARACWRNLRARAEELGYRPGVEEAQGWLQVERD